MSGRSRGSGAAADRVRLRRRRRQALGASAVVLLALAAMAALLVTPHDPGAIRLGDASLAWWAAFASFGLLLVALALGLRSPRRPRAD